MDESYNYQRSYWFQSKNAKRGFIPRIKDQDGSSGVNRYPKKTKGFETDPATLVRRQKQIDYGKNTPEYANYLEMVPKESRSAARPMTPDKNKKTSRRGWDGEIKTWRLLLHAFDPPQTDSVEN